MHTQNAEQRDTKLEQRERSEYGFNHRVYLFGHRFDSKRQLN